MKKRKGRPPLNLTPAMDLLDAARDRIVKRHFEDLIPFSKLADEFGSNPQTLRRWMIKNGIRPRNQQEAGAVRRLRHLNETGNVDAEIVRLRVEEGMKIRDIQDRLDVSHKTIYSVLSAAGATRTTRPPSPRPQKSPRGQAKLGALRPEVLAAIEEGLSCNQLAERFDVAQSSVLRWMKAENLHLNSLTFTQKKIVSLWDASDLNMRAIAEELDCSRTTVSYTLRKVGRIDERKTPGRPPGSGNRKRSILHCQNHQREEAQTLS